MFHNIGILAHVDAGKTTLTEQILYLTGATRSVGSVDKGTAVTDNLSIERERGISVRSCSVSTEYKGVKINIIDTPGHVDFAGEVERSLMALDYAVVLVSAVEGVRSHTENIIKALEESRMPYVVFINKTDRAGADVKGVLSRISSVAKASAVLLSRTENLESDGVEISFLTGEDFQRAVTEGLCDVSEQAEEAFLSDTLLESGECKRLLKEHICSCRALPVLTGSAKLCRGVTELLDFMCEYMPSSDRRGEDQLCGVIYRIEHDKTMGKLSHLRLFGGEIKSRDEIRLIPPEKSSEHCSEESDAVEAEDEKPEILEKVSQIRRLSTGKYTDTGRVEKGDIAVLCGLSSAKTGYFVGSLALSDSYRLATPFLRVRVTPEDESNGEALPALARALLCLSDEEPYMNAQWENGQKDIVINITGKIQLEVIDSLLRERYGIAPRFSPPAVIYKETPAREGIAYADYTMPKPCWAVVKFRYEPMPRGYGVSYHGRLPSNQCFYKYQSHIRTSFNSCLEQGLYGWEVTDFKCTLIGGEHHTIHTHPLDFFVCTPMAFMNGLASTGVTLLEPILKLRIIAPAQLSGKLINEISRMGGEYDGPFISGDSVTLEALVSAAASMDFPVRLASMSSGRAVLGTSFYGYRECRDGAEHINPRRGVNPLDRSKWILWARGAYTLSDK